MIKNSLRDVGKGRVLHSENIYVEVFVKIIPEKAPFYVLNVTGGNFQRMHCNLLNDSWSIIYYTGIWGIIMFVFTCCGFQNMMVLSTFSINNMTFSGIISLGSSDGQNFNHHREISTQDFSVR